MALNATVQQAASDKKKLEEHIKKQVKTFETKYNVQVRKVKVYSGEDGHTQDVELIVEFA